MSAGHTQGFPGFHWQNFTGAEAGDASTSPRLPARTAAASKSPPASSTCYVECRSQSPLQSKTWIFFQISLKSNHGMGAACTRGQVRQGCICCFRLPDEQTGLKARDYPQLRHWEMLSRRVTPTPWAPPRDVCSGSGRFLSLRAPAPGGFPFASVHHLSRQPEAQSGID